MSRFVFIARSSLAWGLFSTLALATLSLGANRPVAWVFMGLFVLIFAAGMAVLDLLERPPHALGAIWLPALLYLLALLWGAGQILPGIWPQDWAHPFWNLVPEAAGHVSADPGQGQHVLLRLACYGLIFWIAARGALSPQAAHRQLQAFALFSSLLAAYGIYAHMSGSNPLLGDWASDVVSASFVNRNSYATFAAFGLVTCLALLLRASNSWETQRRRALAGMIEGLFAGGWIWIAGIVLCGGAVMMTQSRGGAVATLIGLITVLSTLRLRGVRAVFGPGLIFGAITVLVLASASGGVVSRMLTTSDETGRFAVYPQVWEQVMARPLLGHGLGAFEDVFRASVPVEAAVGAWDKAHNSYLENMLELGLPAAAVFYLALAFIGWRLLRGVMTRRRDRAPVVIGFACFLLAGFHAGFDFSLQIPALAGFFSWLTGIAYAHSFSSTKMKDIS